MKLVTITGNVADMSTVAKTRHTAQADAVQGALIEAGGFRSAQDIYAQVRGGGASIGLSTVYRHLQGLAQDGVADVIITPDGETTYRYCRAQGTHHHHLVCRVCGRAEEVEDRAIARWAPAVAAQHGYTDVDHTVEVFGVCSACSAKQARSSAAAPDA